ncbi:tyrosinase family protein [Streptomyces sp. CAU 1734]|uniref:tyrosinase family protein n=1 Tax=Streptomyces sp. CAU 1734 TaxID=3140360 RepID=UPI0032603215
MTIRRNQAHLTPAQRTAFVEAILELKRRGEYDPFITAHRDIFLSDMTNPLRVGHGAPSALPWHRKYLLDFERALQSVNPRVSLPYWDWTRDRTPTASLWAPDFMGGNGRASDGQVMDGPFAHSTGDWTITVQYDDAPFLRRSMTTTMSTLPTRAEVRHVLGIDTYDAAPWDITAPGFRNHLEGFVGADIHNRVHRWVGGHMEQPVSPNDPVFWMHHCFVDKLWSDWQWRHPFRSYVPTAATPGVVSLHEPMPPWNTITPAAMLNHTPYYLYL